MKKLIAAALFFSVTQGASALELVCKGSQPRDPQQRKVTVDCSNRKEVIDALSAAWRTLRQERIGGSTEDMCWKPYNRA